jgi:ribosomal protein S18 acetylase RimI-like enzyme
MLIRRIQKNDAQIIRDLGVAALTDAPYAFGAKLEDVLKEPFEKFAAAARHSESDTSTSFIAFSEAEPIGTIGAYFEQPSQRAFICSLWVKGSHRGGVISQRLLQTAIEWLPERGAQECYAWVSDINKRAISFYIKHQFLNSGCSQPLPSNPENLEHLYIRKF